MEVYFSPAKPVIIDFGIKTWIEDVINTPIINSFETVKNSSPVCNIKFNILLFELKWVWEHPHIKFDWDSDSWLWQLQVLESFSIFESLLLDEWLQLQVWLWFSKVLEIELQLLWFSLFK